MRATTTTTTEQGGRAPGAPVSTLTTIARIVREADAGQLTPGEAVYWIRCAIQAPGADEDHCPTCGARYVWGAGPACPTGCEDETICRHCGEDLRVTDTDTLYCAHGCT